MARLDTRRGVLLAGLILVLIVVALYLFIAQPYWFPTLASEHGSKSDSLFMAVLVVSGIAFVLVQGAQHILGPFGVDCDLRRWGLKLAERGGKSGKKRAIIAVARKLAVLLHHLWVSGEVYEPLHNHRGTTVAAAA